MRFIFAELYADKPTGWMLVFLPVPVVLSPTSFCGPLMSELRELIFHMHEILFPLSHGAFHLSLWMDSEVQPWSLCYVSFLSDSGGDTSAGACLLLLCLIVGLMGQV